MINIEDFVENILWDMVSDYVEQVEELKPMIGNIAYIDINIVEQVDWCEVFDAEELCVVNVEEVNEHLQINFEMPFLLSCWRGEKQLLRVTACVNGICEIPNDDKFDYSAISQMERTELMEKNNIMKLYNIKYSDVEVDQIM